MPSLVVKLAHCAGDPVEAAAVGSTSGRDRGTGCFSFLRFPVETGGRAGFLKKNFFIVSPDSTLVQARPFGLSCAQHAPKAVEHVTEDGAAP